MPATTAIESPVLDSQGVPSTGPSNTRNALESAAYLTDPYTTTQQEVRAIAFLSQAASNTATTTTPVVAPTVPTHPVRSTTIARPTVGQLEPRGTITSSNAATSTTNETVASVVTATTPSSSRVEIRRINMRGDLTQPADGPYHDGWHYMHAMIRCHVAEINRRIELRSSWTALIDFIVRMSAPRGLRDAFVIAVTSQVARYQQNTLSVRTTSIGRLHFRVILEMYLGLSRDGLPGRDVHHGYTWDMSPAERNRLAHTTNGNQDWSLSPTERNRRAHALNGNRLTFTKQDHEVNRDCTSANSSDHALYARVMLLVDRHSGTLGCRSTDPPLTVIASLSKQGCPTISRWLMEYTNEQARGAKNVDPFANLIPPPTVPVAHVSGPIDVRAATPSTSPVTNVDVTDFLSSPAPSPSSRSPTPVGSAIVSPTTVSPSTSHSPCSASCASSSAYTGPSKRVIDDDDDHVATVAQSAVTEAFDRDEAKSLPKPTSPSRPVTDDDLQHVPFDGSRVQNALVVRQGTYYQVRRIPWWDFASKAGYWWQDHFSTNDSVSFAGPNGMVRTEKRVGPVCDALTNAVATKFWSNNEFTHENLLICGQRATQISNTVAIDQRHTTAVFSHLAVTSAQKAFEERGLVDSVAPVGISFLWSLITLMIAAVLEEWCRAVSPVPTTMFLISMEWVVFGDRRSILVHSICLALMWTCYWHYNIESIWYWIYTSVTWVFTPITYVSGILLRASACKIDGFAWAFSNTCNPKPKTSKLLLLATEFDEVVMYSSFSLVFHLIVNICCACCGRAGFSVVTRVMRALFARSTRAQIDAMPTLATEPPTPPAKINMHESAKLELVDSTIKETPALVKVYGIASPSVAPVVFSDTRENQLDAAQRRMLVNTPEPDETLDDFIAWAKTAVRVLFPHACNNDEPNVSIDEFIANTNASGGTLRALKAEAIRMKAEGFNFDDPIDDKVAYKLMSRKAFVKVETLPHRQGHVTKGKAARMIQAACPKSSIILGCVVMAMSKRVKLDIGIGSNIVMASGVSTKEAADHITSRGDTFVKNDVSTWDTSVDAKLTEFEVWLAKRFGAPRAALDLMKANINLHGFTSRGYRFFVKAQGNPGMLTRLYSTPSLMCSSIVTSSVVKQAYHCVSSLIRLTCWCLATIMSLVCLVGGLKSTSTYGLKSLGSSLKRVTAMCWGLSFVLCVYILCSAATCSVQRSVVYYRNLDISSTPLSTLVRHLFCGDPSYPWLASPHFASRSEFISNEFCISRMVIEPTMSKMGTGECASLRAFQLQQQQQHSIIGMAGMPNLRNSTEPTYRSWPWVRKLSNPLSTIWRRVMPSWRGLQRTLVVGVLAADVKMCPDAAVGVLGAHGCSRSQMNWQIENLHSSHVISNFNFWEPYHEANITNPHAVSTRCQLTPVSGDGSTPSQRDRAGAPFAMMSKSKQTRKSKTSKPRISVSVRRVRGRGEYNMPPEAKPVALSNGPRQPGNVNKFARAAGEALGGAISYIPGLGKLIPAPLISAASSALGDAGSWLARAFGFGRYDVRRNSLVRPPRSGSYGPPGGAPISGPIESQSYVASPPQFGSTKKGSDIVFAHREYIGDIKSSINFKSQTFPINPGNPEMFPWMSRIAQLYEEYEMLGCLFEYRSTSATAVGTTSSGMGVVVMATDYDCYDSNFTTKRQMEAAEYSSAAVPFETFLHPIECDRSRNVLAQEYVVPGITKFSDAPGDARLSVLGNFTIATEGQQVDNTTIGELWVTYHIKLSRPVLESTAGSSVYSVHGWGGTSDTGNVSIMGQKVSNGLPGFGLAQSGTGTTARFRFTNAVSKIKGNFLLYWRAISPIPYTPVTPANVNATYGGAATPYKFFVGPITDDPYSILWNNSMPFLTVAHYGYTVCCAFTFNSENDWVEVPSMHSSSIGMNCSFVITQLSSNLEPPAVALTSDPSLRPVTISVVDDDDDQDCPSPGAVTSVSSTLSSTTSTTPSSGGHAAAANIRPISGLRR